MPIIAGRASAAYGAGFAAITAPPYLGPFGSYDALSSVTVGATAVPSVTFTGIPNGYRHLQIRGISRCSRAIASTNVLIIRFNDDATTGNYWSTHNLQGDGASAYTQQIQTVGAVGIWGGVSTGGSAASNTFGSMITDILDYANTNKNKTTRSFQGSEDNAANGIVGMISGLWVSTNPITSITLLDNTGHNFVQYSSFALYGVK
jgi:hypothetical protein